MKGRRRDKHCRQRAKLLEGPKGEKRTPCRERPAQLEHSEEGGLGSGARGHGSRALEGWGQVCLSSLRPRQGCGLIARALPCWGGLSFGILSGAGMWPAES